MEEKQGTYALKREDLGADVGSLRGKLQATPVPVEGRMSVSASGGLRDNVGKAPMALCPMSIITAVSTVIYRSSTEGGGKYPMSNWAKGLSWRQTADCALRHIYRWLEGEEVDQESGLPHLHHLACNVAFLVEFQARGTGQDDRAKINPKTEVK